ncbi:S46 family peptidase [Ideonella sp.]|uniref:S46 family peptidase n=1 Tax=Ideonella sp. TaxID=1929293 RepID=UPI003BB6FD01
MRARAPTYKPLETLRLALQLEDALRLLGPQHPYLQAALAGQTPKEAAARLIAATTLHDPAVRDALIKGGWPAIEASTDPLIVLARTVAPIKRELAQTTEELIDTPLQQAAEQIGQTRYALYGNRVPPDATGTLRLSFGRVAGYQAQGIATPWKTTWGGLLARADSFDQKPPFALPPSVAAHRAQLPLSSALNFVSTADIIGGNSGSPVVNARGELIGLVFDGNLDSLGGRYLYRDERDRAVSVDVQAILQALERVYGAAPLAREMRGL